VRVRDGHRRGALLLVALLIAGCAARETLPSTDAEPVTVQLLAFNDFHGYLEPPGALTLPDPGNADATVSLPAGGAAWLAGTIESLRAEHVRSLLVTAGDMVGASPMISALFADEPTIEALNLMGLAYAAVGNHEFDEGPAELRRLQSGGCADLPDKRSCVDGDFAGARFQYLAANVFEKGAEDSFFPPYAIETVPLGGGERLRIAFIGLVLEGTPEIVNPEAVAGLRFADEAATANALVPELKAKGADLIVALLHEGGEAEAEGGGACPGLRGAVVPILDALNPAVEIVISGHTHERYVCERNGRLLTSAGSYGRLLTRIRLQVDPLSGGVLSRQAENLPVINDTAPVPAPFLAAAADPQVGALVARYRDLAAPIVEREVGRVAGDLTRATDDAGQSSLGALIADALLAAMSGHDPDFAVLGSGGIRDDLLVGVSGVVRFGALKQVLPFGDQVVLLELTAAQLRALLARQWRADGSRHLLQVSRGLEYAWRGNADAADALIPGSIRVGGEPLREDARYRVVTSSFLAGGGDGFEVLEAAPRLARGPGDIEAVTAYLRAEAPRAVPDRDRVQRMP
jgi:5'-nucleotidase